MHMSFVLASLPPIAHSSPSHLTKKLPDLRPIFFVPALEDRPQDPIGEALEQVPFPNLVRQYKDVIEVHGGDEVKGVDAVEKDEDLWTGERVFAERNKRKVPPASQRLDAVSESLVISRIKISHGMRSEPRFQRSPRRRHSCLSNRTTSSTP